jgi:hypothetical protein
MTLYKESAFDDGFVEVLDLHGVPRDHALQILKEAGLSTPLALGGALGGGIYGYMNQPFGLGEQFQEGGQEPEEASPWYDAVAGGVLGGAGGYLGGSALDTLAARGRKKMDQEGETETPPEPESPPPPPPTKVDVKPNPGDEGSRETTVTRTDPEGTETTLNVPTKQFREQAREAVKDDDFLQVAKANKLYNTYRKNPTSRGMDTLARKVKSMSPDARKRFMDVMFETMERRDWTFQDHAVLQRALWALGEK